MGVVRAASKSGISGCRLASVRAHHVPAASQGQRGARARGPPTGVRRRSGRRPRPRRAGLLVAVGQHGGRERGGVQRWGTLSRPAAATRARGARETRGAQPAIGVAMRRRCNRRRPCRLSCGVRSCRERARRKGVYVAQAATVGVSEGVLTRAPAHNNTRNPRRGVVSCVSEQRVARKCAAHRRR